MPFELGELLVQLLTHAMQALELECLAVGERLHLANRIGIVGGECGIDDVVRSQQLSRAGKVGNVGSDLACPHRIVGEAADLRQLDLGIPISAFDQAAHELSAMRPSRLDHPVAQGRGALLIGLDRDPEAFPPAGEQLVLDIGLRLEG